MAAQPVRQPLSLDELLKKRKTEEAALAKVHDSSS